MANVFIEDMNNDCMGYIVDEKDLDSTIARIVGADSFEDVEDLAVDEEKFEEMAELIEEGKMVLVKRIFGEEERYGANCFDVWRMVE
jgi:hypothetical protein